MEELMQLIFKTYGLVGLIMLSPFVAVVLLWRDFRRETKEHQDKVDKINEQRVQDAKAISDKLMILIGEQSSLNTETNMALDRVGDMLSLATIQTRK